MSPYRRRMGPLAASTVLAASLSLVIAWGAQGGAQAASKPPPGPAATLTSITVDPENANGVTTNAPGAWTSNLGDPLSQVGVQLGDTFLNGTQEGITLGEVSIPLEPGSYTFRLYGTGVFPDTTHYGLVLFFDGQQVGPQIAVYNTNPSTDPEAFMVQEPIEGTPSIMGGANGGWFFDYPPGPPPVYEAPNGSTVKLKGFAIDAATGSSDVVGHYNIGPDSTPDMTATVTLKVSAPKT